MPAMSCSDQKARRTQHERLLGGAAQELPCQLACRRNTLKAAVVGAVDVTIVQIGVGVEDIEHGARDVHLGGRRLAAGHIERQALGLDLSDLGFEGLDGGIEFGGFHLLVDRLHGVRPFAKRYVAVRLSIDRHRRNVMKP